MIDPTATVQDVVVEHPQTLAVFEKHGIDYCCGGGKGLTNAAQEQGVDVDSLVAELAAVIASPTDPDAELQPDWSVASLSDLMDYIVSKHHVFVKQQLPRLEGMMSAVVVAHGAAHSDTLRPLQDKFGALKADIDEHLRKEEGDLFPAIRQLGSGDQGNLDARLAETQQEHEIVGSVLHAMRELTAGYAVPADACPTYTGLYRGLAAVERDLHRHIHLENNILFPRAAALSTSA